LPKRGIPPFYVANQPGCLLHYGCFEGRICGKGFISMPVMGESEYGPEICTALLFELPGGALNPPSKIIKNLVGPDKQG
jgi:hypothetical protein